MVLKHIDVESALRLVAERRIEEAMREGKFDHLPGMGQPIELEPLPADENARLMWWTLKILRHNGVIPDEVRWRKTIDVLREHLDRARTEAGVRSGVAQINVLVQKVNAMAATAFTHTLVPLCEAEELDRFRSRTTPASPA
jgi:hypothetical protein